MLLSRRQGLIGAAALPSLGHAFSGEAAPLSRSSVAGCMVGDPNGNDQTAMAVFEQAFDVNVDAMGATPRFMNAFLDMTQDLPQWPSNASWTAWSWKQSTRSANLIPVLGVPMANNWDWNQQPALGRFQGIATGYYDSVFTGVAQAWRDQGFTKLYARVGYEMNGTFMPWWTGSDPTDWLAAFRRIATLMRSVSGITVKIIWNPNLMGSGTQPVANLYPGDAYVDVVGADMFSWTWPGSQLYDWVLDNGTSDATPTIWAAKNGNRAHWWDYPGSGQYDPAGPAEAWGIKSHLAFALAHNKPVAMCECGVGGNHGNGSYGPLDDGFFPYYLVHRLFAPGAPVCEFVNVWNIWNGDGDWRFGGGLRPLAAAAWRKAFGA